MRKTVKFGGSSLADAAQMRKVAAIILADESRRYVVPSAPGKRFKEDIKVTDMLIRCYEIQKKDAEAGRRSFYDIEARYDSIIEELGLDLSLDEEYRQIFESAGFPPLKIVSESRAALVSACQSKHMQVGDDILSRPVLGVDIGSSTTGFAYIMGGKEVAQKIGGEVMLGGGSMDEILLEESVAASPDAKNIRKIFKEI